MRRLFLILLAGTLVGAGAFWVITTPRRADATQLSALPADLGRGEQVFWAAGCASCHTTQAQGAAAAAAADNPLELGGGLALPSDFGTFNTPNISPDPEHGLGHWTLADFSGALRQGVSPEGEHYYPAFPYGAYAKMTDEDVAALWGFLGTLPPVAQPSRPHELGFPFNIRRSLGFWKLLFEKDGWAVETAPDGPLNEVQARGRYLAEALTHCGECHTPRGPLGGLETGRWLAGAPNPSGRGNIPNITPAGLDWSTPDVVAYLTSGFTPEYDTAGGQMAEVVENLARLPDTDRQAIAEYLKVVPPVK